MRRERVLIIDDSATIRAMVEELLDRVGGCRTVAVAADVPAARELLRDFKPTVVTLDLNMPGIGGLAFLDELRDYPNVPVVVVSSTTTEGSAATEQALALGADACFDKGKIIGEAEAFIRVLEKARTTRARMAPAAATARVKQRASA